MGRSRGSQEPNGMHEADKSDEGEEPGHVVDCLFSLEIGFPAEVDER